MKKAAKPARVELPTKPGLYDGIPFGDYCTRLKGANSTLLRKFLVEPPSSVYYDMTHPETQQDTDALLKGHATHAACLEPDLFEELYACPPAVDMRTNAGKAAAQEWADEHPNQIRILERQYNLVLAMRDKVLANPLAAELLGSEGRAEVTALWDMPVWKEKATGEIKCQPESPGKGWARAGEVRCKGRFDKTIVYEKWGTVLDLKTDRDASTDGFGKACAHWNYHAQAAMYLDALDILSPRKRRFIHIVVEKKPPHNVAIRELDVPEIREGRAAYQWALALYVKCMRTKQWPGYFAGVEPQEMNRRNFKFTDPMAL
jgi:hypothetical protein